jgi:tRNA (guanine37-N1)-methyltransferase
MRVHIATLFPDYFRGPFDCGPTRAALDKGLLTVETVNPRDFTTDPHRTVDDYPFGGGAGMVLKPGPLFRAVESVREPGSRVVLLSARGRRFDQVTAGRLHRREHLVLVCGRYKDVDERFRASAVDEELSVGDFILAGGEAAAVVVVEALARLFPEAVEHPESVTTDSFSSGLLDAPWYTRPREFRGMAVPDVLVSGDHAAVARWRREQSLILTARRRPELLRDEVLSADELAVVRSELAKENHDGQENQV